MECKDLFLNCYSNKSIVKNLEGGVQDIWKLDDITIINLTGYDNGILLMCYFLSVSFNHKFFADKML